MLREVRNYFEMARGIAQLLRAPVPTTPEENLRQAFLNRETTFLKLAERVAFQHGNPYAEMFAIAGCQYGDLSRMVRSEGLDATLVALRRAGVYLTQAEWKSKQPIVRGGRE